MRIGRVAKCQADQDKMRIDINKNRKKTKKL